MRRSRGTVSCKTNRRVFYQYWLPDRRPRALVLLVHGLAEHGGRYGHVGQYLVDCGVGVCALDLPGHGQSYGSPGHIARFSHYLDAVAAIQSQVQSDHEGIPLAIMGHSMGGLVVANYLLEHQHDFFCCVLSAPALQSTDAPGKVLGSVLKGLSASMPRVGVLSLDAEAVSRDPAVVRRYQNDPMVYRGRISARLTQEMLDAMTHARNFASSVRIPILLMHGGQDRLTDINGTNSYHKHVVSPDKRLQLYPDLYHELLNEPERRHVLKQVMSWLRAHIPQK